MSKEEIAQEFNIEVSELDNCQILFAVYKTEPHEGSALVVFMRDGKLYEVKSTLCSCYSPCYGLENQWNPKETSLEALRMIDFTYYGFEKEAEGFFIDLIFEKEVLVK